MSLKEVQDEVHTWIDQYKIGYWKPHEILAQLTEEVGEIARVLNHEHGPKKKKESEDQQLGDEIADAIFALTCLANSLDIDMDKSFKKGMDKRYGRDNDRWEKK